MKLSLIGIVPLLSGDVCSFTMTNRNALTRKDYQLFADTGEIGEVSALQGNLDDEEESTSVTSFLKFIGPYPCLPLRFPNLATSSQRERRSRAADDAAKTEKNGPRGARRTSCFRSSTSSPPASSTQNITSEWPQPSHHTLNMIDSVGG